MKVLLTVLMGFASAGGAWAALIEFNNGGGTTATNGLHFYIEDSTKIQVRRLNNTGQVYSPTVTPPNNSLDNGVFLRANGKIYGPDHTVNAFTPTGGMYNTSSISAASPANPSSSGVQQTATGNFGISSGPQVSVVWKYTTPLDFLTADVTLTIPAGYAVSAANPVRYYHVFDTYLGGSDSGCGVSFVDANGKRVIGTYPPASGTTCPSSTSIPTGVSVVESFRERSGLTFTNYCSAGWATFYTNGLPNCSVLQPAVMSNTVVTTYQDTGIGIEFDFTTSGTYTFSYDFVVGSPNVPPYDHLEIRHDGTTTLCPDNVIVLACTSSTVPCPVANLVNTGTLTGAVTTTPIAPAVTKTPSTFSIGSASSTATVALQGAVAGAYVLGSSGLSTVPLNGTKCWNTVTLSQSCAFTVTAVPCVSGFECMETGVTYNNLTVTPAARNPLYTKLAGANFKFDVVALQTGGVPAASYSAASNVTVELFDDSASPQPACSAYASPVATQAITFAAGDLGRKTLTTNVNLTNAYSKLRCRVKDSNLTPTVFGCSSDDFSVRPSAATLVSSATAAVAPSAAATPIFKAGANFTLNATTSPGASYAGALALDTGKLTAQITGQDTTRQIGGVVGTLTPSSLTANASAVNATYSEVGYLYLAPGAYRDDTFTAVDSANGDCITDTSSDGNLADTLSGGKYGCSIGNKTAVSFGRFVPDHFLVAQGNLVNRRLAVCAPASNFTYEGEEMQLQNFTLTARNALATPTMTNNYAGVFARFDGGVIANFGLGAVDLADATPPMAARAFVVGAGAGQLGLVSSNGGWTTGLGTFSANLQLNRAAAPDGPYESFRLGAAPVDADGVTVRAVDKNLDITAPADLVNDRVLVGSTAVRFGRLRLANAMGPDTRNLRMAMETQHWNGTNFIRNLNDSCTVVPASAWSFGNYVRRPASVVFNPLVAADTTLALGAAFVTIPRPAGGRVTFDASINLATTGAETAASSCLKNLALGTPTRPWTPVVTSAAPSPVRPGLPYLLGQWCDATYTNNPSARGSFGLYRGAESSIFQRENY